MRLDSTTKCNDRFVEDIDWCSVAERFSGSIIELVHDRVQGGRGDGGEVCFLGKVLADESVGILGGAAFLRVEGVGKVDIDCEPLFEFFEVSELGTVVQSQRVDEVFRDVSEGSQRGLVERGGPFVGHQSRDEQA